MNVQVRAVALDTSSGLLRVPLISTGTASFTWVVDTIPPTAIIGTAALGTAPQPCSNPTAHGANYTQFVISSNEPVGVSLQCRLSNWVDSYGNFDNALERWNSTSVALWLRDPKHIQAQQVQLDLSTLIPALASVNGSVLAVLDAGSLTNPPYSISSATVRSSLLAAIELQRTPFQSCRENRTVPAVVAR
jgi:hypothetical protein